MNASPKLWMALALSLSTCGPAHAEKPRQGSYQANLSHTAFASNSSIAVPEKLGEGLEVTRYATELDGDHSLHAATVAEKVFARYALYTVRLQFASGREQCIAVMAPPGGLEPEMRDMSGDSIPNDLVFTSKLLRAPLVVLLNDGHDHLTVAVSPGSFASGDGKASRPHQAHRASALLTSRFKTRGIAGGGSALLQRFGENFVTSFAQTLSTRVQCAPVPGRAPPALVTQT